MIKPNAKCDGKSDFEFKITGQSDSDFAKDPTTRESIWLKVNPPVTLKMDNKGGVNIFNNWSIAGNTGSISVRFAYVRELKEQGILKIEWIKSEDNPVDIFTKDLDGAQ